MYKFQLVFITGKEERSSDEKFKVYENEALARQALTLYTEVSKPRDIKKGCVVELSKVLFTDGRPCTARLVTRINVSEGAIIEAKKVEVKKVTEKKTNKKT